MKGSGGDCLKTPETLANPTIGMTFDQGRLLALERLNQELKDSMMQIMQMMQNWNMNPPPRRRIEREVSNEFDDLGMEYELEEAQRPRR